MPQRGDIVIVTPPGTRTDYIKRVIGLPGDTIRMVDGQLFINGQPVKRQAESPDMIPIDVNSPCGSPTDPALYDLRVQGPDGKGYCRVPIVRETLPNGRTYETVELGRSSEDSFGPVTVPAGHLWLMGDNRDDSADSRVPARRTGAVGKYRRPRRVHHLLPRWVDSLVEPAELDRGAAPRPRRTIAPE
jgi:signal peptidase I